jgi:glycine/D-amino acid oxidase-like deaminating enzyme
MKTANLKRETEIGSSNSKTQNYNRQLHSIITLFLFPLGAGGKKNFMLKPTAIVIGTGITGLAMARALAIKGYTVTILERGHKATGASIRNFGMVWPIGQSAGKLYERAIRSRNIWQEISNTGAFPCEQTGSLHLAYNENEWNVLQELHEQFRQERPVTLLTPEQVVEKSPAVVPRSNSQVTGLFTGTTQHYFYLG